MTDVRTSLLWQRVAELVRQCDERAAFWQQLHFRARMAVLFLGLLTALVGAVVTSLGITQLTVVGLLKGVTVLLPLIAAALTALLGTLNMAKKWVAYRAAAETLKSEAYLYATAADKYARDDRDRVLEQRLQSIEQDLVKQTGARLKKGGLTMVPSGPLSPETYLKERVQDQQEWYRRKAAMHERTRVVLASLIFAANTLAAVLAFLSLLLFESLQVWVGVITTLIGVLTTYAALTAADFLANSYVGTAQQLADLERAWREGEYSGSPEDFHRFVRQVEQVISREHSGWNAVVRHSSAHDS